MIFSLLVLETITSSIHQEYTSMFIIMNRDIVCVMKKSESRRKSIEYHIELIYLIYIISSQYINKYGDNTQSQTRHKYDYCHLCDCLMMHKVYSFSYYVYCIWIFNP